MVRSPVDICLGTRPIQAEKSRPLANAAPLPIAATIALEMIGPMPGTVMTLRQLLSLFAKVSISLVTGSIRSSSCRQSLARSATMRTMRGDRTSVRLARMSGSAWRWYPPAEMLVRKPELTDMVKMPGGLGMKGGPDNPIGARAMYLYCGNKDTLYRIHGTNEPWTIGTNVSSGCIRLTNEDIVDLYNRTPIGAKVIVFGTGKPTAAGQ